MLFPHRKNTDVRDKQGADVSSGHHLVITNFRLNNCVGQNKFKEQNK